MYQNFSNAAAIIDRLDQEILAEANLNKRAFLSTEEAENRARARKLPDLSKEETWIHEALSNKQIFVSKLPQEAPIKAKETELENWIQTEWTTLPENDRHASEDEINKWRDTLSRVRYSSSASLGKRELLVLHDEIVGERRDYDTRVRPLKDGIHEIDENAQLQITAIYEKLKPKLPKLIAGSPGAPNQFGKGVAWLSFDPHAVLDARNGTFVVYQIFRLALIMVLGLGLIFLIVFFIRLIPPMARGTDQFIENAGEFFKRSDGGGSQVAKSLLMTVSAIGIGAAVVVGTNALSPTAVAGDYYAANQDERDGKSGDKDRNRNPRPGGAPDSERGPRGEDGLPGLDGAPGSQVDLHRVELVPPIVYPSPITVSGPTSVTLSAASLDPVVKAITDIQAIDLNARISIIVDKAITDKLKDKDVVKPPGPTPNPPPNPPKSNDCCATDLGPRIDTLESWQKTYGAPALLKLDFLAKEIQTMKEAGEKAQNDNLERTQNSGGRGFATGAKQLFQGDKYIVTRRTVDALRLLMRKPATDCDPTKSTAADAATKKCCGEKQADLPYCPIPAVEEILKKLSSMVGDPPQSESDFMKQLRQIRGAKGDSFDKAIDQWKPIILKYTRMAY